MTEGEANLSMHFRWVMNASSLTEYNKSPPLQPATSSTITSSLL